MKGELKKLKLLCIDFHLRWLLSVQLAIYNANDFKKCIYFYVTALQGTVCNYKKGIDASDLSVLLIHLYICHWDFFPYLKTFVFPDNAPEADSVYRAEISL